MDRPRKLGQSCCVRRLGTSAHDVNLFNTNRYGSGVKATAEFNKIVACRTSRAAMPPFALATSRQQVSNRIIPSAIG